MATQQSNWVQRGRAIATRLRAKWGAAVAARERTRELIARDRAEARAEAAVGGGGADRAALRGGGKRAEEDRPTESS